MTRTELSFRTDSFRIDRLVAGIAGLVGVAVLGVFIGFVTIPDVTAGHAASAVAKWLADPHTAAGVTGSLAVGAFSYVFLLVFAAGVHRVARSWDASGIWPTVAAVGFGLFLAGALASDAFEWAVPLTLASTSGFSPDPALVAVLDRGWLIALMEAQLALATSVAAVTVAGLRSRRGNENRAPIALLVIGVVAAVAIIPFVLLPTTQIVLLLSNQTRLLWIVVLAIWMIVSAVRRSRAAARPSDANPM